MVLDVLTRFKQSEVEKAIGQLDTDEIDVLMKYIYRGFAEANRKIMWYTTSMAPTCKLPWLP